MTHSITTIFTCCNGFRVGERDDHGGGLADGLLAAHLAHVGVVHLGLKQA